MKKHSAISFAAVFVLSLSGLTCCRTADAVPDFGQHETAYAAPGYWYDGFVYASANDVTIPDPTRFQVSWDKENLYVDVEMQGSHLKKTQSRTVRQGKWPEDESVEVFLDPAGTSKSFFQVAAGKDGAHYDSRARRDPGFWKKTKWSTVSLKDEDGCWHVRFILPFTDPDMRRPETGDAWKFNVCRNRTVPQRYQASWAKVGREFHNPGKFAKLAFGSPEEFRSARDSRLKNRLARIRGKSSLYAVVPDFSARLQEAESSLDAGRVTALEEELEMLGAMSQINQ